jgi:multiple sugar transport system permease protein
MSSSRLEAANRQEIALDQRVSSYMLEVPETDLRQSSSKRFGSTLSSWVDKHFAVLTVMPTLTVTILVFGLPLILSLMLSFQGWNAQQSLFGGRFVGLANYIDLFNDPQFTQALWLTIAYTVITVFLELAIGLGVALLLNKDVPFVKAFRTALIVPMMITPIVASMCWKLLLDPNYGIVDYFIGSPILWLGDPTLARISVGFVNVWQNAPYVAILLLAGLRSLPSEPIEAAAIDGATRFQIFRHVTFPLLTPYIIVALLLRTIFEFRTFDNVWVMTGGGPADATKLLSVYTFMTSFFAFDMSLGAAASWIMLLIVFVFCVLFVAASRRKENAL